MPPIHRSALELEAIRMGSFGQRAVSFVQILKSEFLPPLSPGNSNQPVISSMYRRYLRNAFGLSKMRKRFSIIFRRLSPDHIIGNAAHVGLSGQRHGHTQLAPDQFDGLRHTGFAHRAEPVEERFADQSGMRAAG